MKRVFTLLTALTLMFCMNVQAGSPSLIENFNNGKVLQGQNISINDAINLTAEESQLAERLALLKGGDFEPREAKPFEFGLVPGMNLFGFGFGLNVSTGKTKFQDNNAKEPVNIGLSQSIEYQRMLCHSFALGAFLSYATSISKNRDDDFYEGDYKDVAHALLIGIIATNFWGFGSLNRGGVLASYSLGTGFTGDKSTSGDVSNKSNKTALLSLAVAAGGWVQPTPCMMFFATIGFLSYDVQFLKGSSDQKYRDHNFNVDIASWNPTIGLRFICGGKEGHREARK